MAKTYIPTLTYDAHDLLLYMTRYGSVIRPALVLLDPNAVVAYDLLYNALQALERVREVLIPELP